MNTKGKTSWIQREEAWIQKERGDGYSGRKGMDTEK